MYIHGNFAALFRNGAEKMQQVQQSAVKQAAALRQMGSLGLRSPQDKVSISPYGKANSALSMLEKLKGQIEDRKNEFITKAAEDGMSAEAVKAQVESFDQQLKEVDKQILQMTIEQTNQAIEKEKSASSTSIKRPKTRQEVENERLADITSMSAGLDRAEAISSTKTQVDGDIGIKEAEIALDKSRNQDTAKREAELAALQGHSNQLLAGIGDQLNETLEEIEESNDKVINAEIVEEEKTEGKDDKDAEAGGKVEGTPHSDKTAAKDQLVKPALREEIDGEEAAEEKLVGG